MAGQAMMFVLAGTVLGCCAYVTPTTMTAAAATSAAEKEGDFSMVKVMSLPVPKPAEGEVLIRVAASSINPVDWKILTMPTLQKMINKSGPKILGFDVAGTIEAVGSGCDRLKSGDEVWADLGKMTFFEPLELGGWAHYALADESQVGLKSKLHSFAEAGSLPLVSLTGYQAFQKAGAPWKGKPDLTVVITSGAGGTGTPAIQMAKYYGAKRIITSASPSNFALLKGLGATDVFDYHKTTIWKELENNSVDFVYDNYGAPGTADLAMPSLRPGGVFEFLPGKGGAVSANPKQGVTQINFGLCDPSNYSDLDALKVMADDGYLEAIIKDSFTLENIHGALNASFFGHGGAGKISVVVPPTVTSEIFV